jgi:hypothetical protein
VTNRIDETWPNRRCLGHRSPRNDSNGARIFTLPGVLTATAVAVPAKPKRKGKDPFTGEERMLAAKPASVRVKIRALKKLKSAAV